MKNKILDIKAREILDSRGNPTVECEIFFEGENGQIRKAWSAVPSGASTGDFEAYELRDGDENRFGGKGVLKAIENIEKKIAPELIGLDITEQEKIDNLMINLDGSKNKSNLGANAILAVSMAVCRAGAIAENQKLYEYIWNLNRGEKSEFTIPRAFYNVINGGQHAGNKVAFQEFMISPNLNSFEENYRAVSEIYQTLKKILKTKFGGAATLLGDEGGFAPNDFDREDDALDLIMEAVEKAGYGGKVGIGFDIAASEFFQDRKYNLGYKTNQDNFKNIDELIEIYLNLLKKYPIISIEDPFDQSDFFAFSKLREVLKKENMNIQVVGDDLTVSNPERIKTAIDNRSCDALLLKLNQIGTVSEAINSAQLAKNSGWKIMVSHRSGETTDDFIADFSVGIGAEQIKSGAPARGERVCKYNRLLTIEKETK